MRLITRVVLVLCALLFTGMGLGFWLAPDRLAERFSVVASGPAGYSTLRGDFGGMFLAMAALTVAGVVARRRAPLQAAATVLILVVLGRLATWALSGNPAGLMPNLPVEIVAAAALLLHARSLPADGVEGRGRGWLVALGIVAALVAVGVGALSRPALQDRLVARAADAQIRRNNAALLNDDALRVSLCGTSAPLPSPKRAKACVAVMAGGKFYIVDAGPESTENLMQWGLPLDRIGGVLLTHFHSDHIGDLGELNLQTWVQGRPAPLAVYGGPGVERVVAGFNEAYAIDQGYRTAHHTAALMPPATWPMAARPILMPGAPTAAMNRSAVVLDDGVLKITAYETDHRPVEPAYAYRFDYKGRSILITGDTRAHAPLAAAAKGADILMSEALNRDMVRQLRASADRAGKPRIAHIMGDIQSYHIAPTEAADLANRSGAKLLVLYHLIPAPDNALLKHIFTRGLNDARKGDWDVAEDGSLYTLPVGSKAVTISRVP